jgi:hypothetical protein
MGVLIENVPFLSVKPVLARLLSGNFSTTIFAKPMGCCLSSKSFPESFPWAVAATDISKSINTNTKMDNDLCICSQFGYEYGRIFLETTNELGGVEGFAGEWCFHA